MQRRPWQWRGVLKLQKFWNNRLFVFTSWSTNLDEMHETYHCHEPDFDFDAGQLFPTSDKGELFFMGISILKFQFPRNMWAAASTL